MAGSPIDEKNAVDAEIIIDKIKAAISERFSESGVRLWDKEGVSHLIPSAAEVKDAFSKIKEEIAKLNYKTIRLDSNANWNEHTVSGYYLKCQGGENSPPYYNQNGGDWLLHVVGDTDIDEAQGYAGSTGVSDANGQYGCIQIARFSKVTEPAVFIRSFGHAGKTSSAAWTAWSKLQFWDGVDRKETNLNKVLQPGMYSNSWTGGLPPDTSDKMNASLLVLASRVKDTEGFRQQMLFEEGGGNRAWTRSSATGSWKLLTNGIVQEVFIGDSLGNSLATPYAVTLNKAASILSVKSAENASSKYIVLEDGVAGQNIVVANTGIPELRLAKKDFAEDGSGGYEVSHEYDVDVCSGGLIGVSVVYPYKLDDSEANQRTSDYRAAILYAGDSVQLVSIPANLGLPHSIELIELKKSTTAIRLIDAAPDANPRRIYIVLMGGYSGQTVKIINDTSSELFAIRTYHTPLDDYDADVSEGGIIQAVVMSDMVKEDGESKRILAYRYSVLYAGNTVQEVKIPSYFSDRSNSGIDESTPYSIELKKSTTVLIINHDKTDDLKWYWNEDFGSGEVNEDDIHDVGNWEPGNEEDIKDVVKIKPRFIAIRGGCPGQKARIVNETVNELWLMDGKTTEQGVEYSRLLAVIKDGIIDLSVIKQGNGVAEASAVKASAIKNPLGTYVVDISEVSSFGLNLVDNPNALIEKELPDYATTVLVRKKNTSTSVCRGVRFSVGESHNVTAKTQRQLAIHVTEDTEVAVVCQFGIAPPISVSRLQTAIVVLSAGSCMYQQIWAGGPMQSLV